MTTYCSILPPYLLDAVATHCDGEVAERAAHTLRVEATMRSQREVRAARAPRPDPARSPDLDAGPAGDDHADDDRGGSEKGGAGLRGIVPIDLLEKIGHEDDRTLRADLDQARRRKEAPKPAPPGPPAAATPQRPVHDAQPRSTLPGDLVRPEGGGPVGDESANEAYDGLGATWHLLRDVYGRDSLDGRALPLVASVHFRQGYDNAFWNGDQMVFGDGDGVIFRSFTDSVDVIGHELAHGLTQYTAGLIYLAQPGALNESISDVFGVLTEQYLLGQTVEQASWLVGAQLFESGVQGVALRSMNAPGTAYDDPRLGKDPQPAHMRDYREMPHDDSGDNGGVHVNSGIPNRAFYLLAEALGGHAWERAGRIWFDTLTAGGLPKDADFARFAAATEAAAKRRYGDGEVAEAVRAAWAQVGVSVGAPLPDAPAPGRQPRTGAPRRERQTDWSPR